MTSFRYQEGFHAPRGLSAETAAIALDDVRKSCGALTAENVVNAARAKENPLHKAFEWNDNTAAEKYRLQQANQLIRCVVIIEQNEEPYRYFTLAGDKTTKATYLPTSMVISRPDLFQDGLLRLKRELAGSLRSVEELMRVATKNNPSAAKKLAAVKKTLERANDLLG